MMRKTLRSLLIMSLLVRRHPKIWRRRICSPPPYHSAMLPNEQNKQNIRNFLQPPFPPLPRVSFWAWREGTLTLYSALSNYQVDSWKIRNAVLRTRPNLFGLIQWGSWFKPNEVAPYRQGGANNLEDLKMRWKVHVVNLTSNGSSKNTKNEINCFYLF